MRLSRGSVSLDLRLLGLDRVSEQQAVRVGEMQLLDRSYVLQDKGLGPRSWEVAGAYRQADARAVAAWSQLMVLKNEPNPENRRLVLSQFVRGPDALIERTERLGQVYITGTPRRSWVELVNGIPRTYRWQLKLVEAPDG